MEILRKYFWMVQKGKGRRIWIISLNPGSVSFINTSQGLSFSLMLVPTPGGLATKMVLLGLLVGLFSIGVLPRLVTLISSEFAFQTSISFPVLSSS
jgi:Zn-dependent membrane protease YugP